MKKKILTSFLVLLVISNCCFICLYLQSEKEYRILFNATKDYSDIGAENNNIDALEQAFRNDIEKNGTTTEAMIEITSRYTEIWETEMNKCLEYLEKYIDSDELRNSQTLWEEYIDDHNQLILGINQKVYEGGTYLNLLQADLEYQKYKCRVEALSGLCNTIIGFNELTEN